MTRSSEASAALTGILLGEAAKRKLSPTQRRLRIAAIVLLVLNGVALYFYLLPPGGTKEELAQQSVEVQNQIAAARLQSAKMKGMAANVETGSDQASGFAAKYFLAKRTAYVTVFEEIQRLAQASGIQERDAAWNEEPIEGTTDLTLLTVTANYEGTNANLMKLLYEADRSPMLLILDALTASPQQKNNQINTVMRFQAVVRESGPAGAQGGQL